MRGDIEGGGRGRLGGERDNKEAEKEEPKEEDEEEPKEEREIGDSNTTKEGTTAVATRRPKIDECQGGVMD